MPKKNKKVQPTTESGIDQLLKRGGPLKPKKRESASTVRSRLRSAGKVLATGLSYLADKGPGFGDFGRYTNVLGAERALTKRKANVEETVKELTELIDAN